MEWILPFHGGYLVCVYDFSSISDLYPLDASITLHFPLTLNLSLTIKKKKNVYRHCSIYPQETNLPLVQSHYFKVMPIPSFGLYCSLVYKLLKIVCFLAPHQTLRFHLQLLSGSIRPQMTSLQILLHCKVFCVQMCKSMLIEC